MTEEHRRILSGSLYVGFGLAIAAAFGDFSWWLVPVVVVAAYGLGWGYYGLRRVLKGGPN